jgi:hypothetical protein
LPPLIYSIAGNADSALMVDLRYETAKQFWADAHRVIPVILPDPIDRTKQPEAIQQYIKENGFDGGLEAHAQSLGLVLINGVYQTPGGTLEAARAAAKVVSDYLAAQQH